MDTDTGEEADELDPREEARIHRRDHDAEASRHDLMRPGMGKVFKQITDAWAEKAARDHDRGQRKGGKGSGASR